MYLSHTGPTAKKAEKETKVTSVHGSKTAVLAAVACCTSVAVALGAKSAEKKARLKLYEKGLETAQTELEENNRIQLEKAGVPELDLNE